MKQFEQFKFHGVCLNNIKKICLRQASSVSTVDSRLANMIKKIISHFFSIPCPACKKEAAVNNSEFCLDCIEKLNIIHPPFCPGCGGELDGILDVCSKCLKEETAPWIFAIALMPMKGPGRELVQRFKYKNDTSLARPFAALAVNALENSDILKPINLSKLPAEPPCLGDLSRQSNATAEASRRREGKNLRLKAGNKNRLAYHFDLISPVPLHWTRRISRGYNQSALLARQISSISKIKYKKALYRNKYTQSQAKLSGSERRKNINNAFSVADSRLIKDKRILLVDDVFTTGSTLRSAAKELLKANPKSVSILVLARR
jgi:ComF family protein